MEKLKLKKGRPYKVPTRYFWRACNDQWDFFLVKEVPDTLLDRKWIVLASSKIWEARLDRDPQVIKRAKKSEEFLKTSLLKEMRFSTRREALEALEAYLND